MKISFYLSLFAIVFSFISCGNADDDVSLNLNNQALGLGSDPDVCLGFGDNQLLLSIQDQYTTAPSKISVLFRVTDTNSTPISGLTADQFTIYEQGRNDDCFNTISPSESSARIAPNEQVFSNNAILVLDLSNSVLESSLKELKSASGSFLNSVMPNVETESFKMAIYWFDGEDKLHRLQDFTSSKAELTAAIDSIDENISSDPSTDLYGAVIKSTGIAEDLIARNSRNSFVSAVSLVIFTDGTDQASRYSENQALKIVEEANPNISFFSIGLGAEIDTEVLQQIGKTESVFATDKDDLEDTFNEISLKVSQAANSFYLFEYCTPKRDGSGNNNLVIRLSNNGLSGAVQTRFNATGFSAGCQ